MLSRDGVSYLDLYSSVAFASQFDRPTNLKSGSYINVGGPATQHDPQRNGDFLAFPYYHRPLMLSSSAYYYRMYSDDLNPFHLKTECRQRCCKSDVEMVSEGFCGN